MWFPSVWSLSLSLIPPPPAHVNRNFLMLSWGILMSDPQVLTKISTCYIFFLIHSVAFLAKLLLSIFHHDSGGLCSMLFSLRDFDKAFIIELLLVTIAQGRELEVSQWSLLLLLTTPGVEPCCPVVVIGTMIFLFNED